METIICRYLNGISIFIWRVVRIMPGHASNSKLMNTINEADIFSVTDYGNKEFLMQQEVLVPWLSLLAKLQWINGSESHLSLSLSEWSDLRVQVALCLRVIFAIIIQYYAERQWITGCSHALIWWFDSSRLNPWMRSSANWFSPPS